MSNEQREELAESIGTHLDGISGFLAWTNQAPVDLADKILAAGYRKPRTITTVEELHAAIYSAFEDGGHLVVSDRRGRPWIIWADEDDDAWVDSWPQEEDPERLSLSDITLPATVLHEAVTA